MTKSVGRCKNGPFCAYVFFQQILAYFPTVFLNPWLIAIVKLVTYIFRCNFRFALDSRDGRGWGGKGETVAPPDGGPGNKNYFSFLSKSCLRCLKGWKLFWIIFQTQSVYEHHFKLWNYIIPWKYINIIRYQIALTARNDVYVLTKISKSAEPKTEAAPGRSGTASATLT